MQNCVKTILNNFFYICNMLKKNLILCLLLFFYTVVLAHNALPHGHFDEIFSTEHDSDSHEHGEHSNHDHHFLFSHSVSLHVTIEKQLTYSTVQTKVISKNFQNFDSFCLAADALTYPPPDTFWLPVYYAKKSPSPTCCSTAFTRGPPLP